MKPFKMLTFSLLLFLIFAVIAFVAISYLNPEEDDLENNLLETLQNPEIKAQFQFLKTQSESLRIKLSISDEQKLHLQSVIDSLQGVLAARDKAVETRTKEIERLNELLSAKQQQEDQAKELAKTFGTMKSAELSPLLDNLDNETIIRIYENMNSRTRKNLLLALSSRRASIVTRKIADRTNP